MRPAIFLALLFGATLGAPITRHYEKHDDEDAALHERRYDNEDDTLAARAFDDGPTWVARRGLEDDNDHYTDKDGDTYYRKAGDVVWVTPKNVYPPGRERKNKNTKVRRCVPNSTTMC